MPKLKGGVKTVDYDLLTKRIGIFSATVMIIIGVFGIFGWVSGIYLTFNIQGIEMISPVAAIAYLLLGSIVMVLAIPLRSRYAKLGAKFLTSFIMVIGCMFWISAAFFPSLDIQKIVVVPLIGAGSSVETTIAPLAAFAIFLGTIALTRIIYQKIKWRHYDKVPGIISLVVFSMGFLSLVGYAFGSPQFYGGSVRAVSISSSFALFFFGIGIAALNGPKKWPLSVLMSDNIAAQMIRILIPLMVVAFLCYSWIIFRVIIPTSTDPVTVVALFTVITIVGVTYSISYVSERTRRIVDKAQREKTKAIEALALANRKLEMLDSLTRHDVLNQVSLASIEAELTKRMSKEPRIQESAENIARINKTIIALLQFSKEYKQVGLEHPRWIDIEETLSKAMEQLERGSITMASYGTNWKVYSDPMIEKAFFNILENSLRHGEKARKVTVECEVSPGDGSLSIVFSDDGMGVPEAEKESIFEKGVGKHTGLGLFLVRQILAITGISIVENGVPGQGARFEITVPNGNFEATFQP